MAVTLKGSYTWISVVLLLVFTALRLDGRLEWNWFYVLIPAWLFDSVMLLYITAQAITEVKRRPTRRLAIILNRLWDLSAVLNKILFQVLICLKLQAIVVIQLSYVFFPLWALLLQMAASLVYRIYLHEKTSSSLPIRRSL
ncbi:hypothetical protein BV898_03769 [Hypsibius exemplaris]|uniref:Transmembrane protein 60 n=1 Tax=Hypsibius exemplaris TaxID=2072580 RepID=A0A1W0X453_HYPEX|nr:hypothetical protein BV898_03769 [Hypsibius exemplaris]